MRICVVSFLLYSAMVFILFAGLNYAITRQLVGAYTVLDDVFDYKDALEEDDFSKIPIKSLKDCDIIVLDEAYNTLYTTDQDISASLKKEDIELINDYAMESFYRLYRYGAEDGSQRFVITLCRYNEDINELLDYCVLDENYQIIEGTLFPDATQITETQLELICGTYHNKRNVERRSYETRSGEKRILIFFSSFFDYKKYERIQASAERLWLLAVPVVLAAIVLLTLLLVRKISLSLEPLNQAIVAYGEGHRMELNNTQMPAEFRRVVANFDQMMDQVEASQQAAKQAYQEKQRVLADISHDIKTPLTVIQGYSKALADGLAPEDKKGQYIRIIYDRAETVAGMVTALVDYTKIEHPDFSLSLERKDFCEFCREYLSEKYQEIDLSGFILDIDIPETPIYAEIDTKMMKRVLENLINNALKYNPTSTVISVQVEDGAEIFWLTVADNGTGIAEELRPNIFAPFVSGNHARTTGSGSGIGLTIVKTVVERHGGTVTLTANPRNGASTEFCITLPKAPDAAPPKNALKSPQ